MLLNKQWVTEKIKREIKKFLKTNENGNKTYKIMTYSKSNIKWEEQSNKHLH